MDTGNKLVSRLASGVGLEENDAYVNREYGELARWYGHHTPRPIQATYALVHEPTAPKNETSETVLRMAVELHKKNIEKQRITMERKGMNINGVPWQRRLDSQENPLLYTNKCGELCDILGYCCSIEYPKERVRGEYIPPPGYGN